MKLIMFCLKPKKLKYLYKNTQTFKVKVSGLRTKDLISLSVTSRTPYEIFSPSSNVRDMQRQIQEKRLHFKKQDIFSFKEIKDKYGILFKKSSSVEYYSTQKTSSKRLLISITFLSSVTQLNLIINATFNCTYKFYSFLL